MSSSPSPALPALFSSLRALGARLDESLAQLERECRRVHAQHDAEKVEDRLEELVFDVQDCRRKITTVRDEIRLESEKVKAAVGHVSDAGKDLAAKVIK